MANSKRKCRHCGEYQKADTMVVINGGAFCSMDAAIAHGMKNRELGAKKKEKAKRQETNREKRARLDRSIPHHLHLTKTMCNKLVRLLDEGRECISCGKPKCGSDWHAGHYKSVGSHPELRFDLRNIHRQGSGCNLATAYRGRNPLTVQKEYEQRLADRYGQEFVDYLNGPHEPKNYTIEELKALRAEFIAEIKRIETGLGPSKDWRAL